MRLAISCLATILLSAPALAAPKVIASIVPVHSIVAAVMGDIGNPELLLSGKNSESLLQIRLDNGTPFD